MKLKDNYIKINGLKIYYLEGGSGRPLLIIPGWLAIADMYRETGELLADNHHVIILEVPGIGRSAHLKRKWGFEDYKRITFNFINYLNLDNLILVGHSFGGAIGAAVLQETDKAAELVMVNSIGLKINKMFITGFKGLWKENSKKTILKYVLIFTSSAVMNIRNFYASLKIISELNLADVLKKITKKVTILWGEDDLALSMDYGLRLHKVILKSKFVIIKGGGLNCIIFKPKKFVKYFNTYV